MDQFWKYSGIISWILIALGIIIWLVYRNRKQLPKTIFRFYSGTRLYQSVQQLREEVREKNIQEETVVDVGTGVFVRLTRIGIFAVLAALIPTAFIIVQTILLDRQNEKINLQNNLIEADRRGSLIILMSNVLDQMNNEIETLRDSNRVHYDTVGYPLTDPLIGRIAALSQGFRPYRFLEGDNLTDEATSPERGQLLLALVKSNLDSVTYNKIYLASNFSSADLSNTDLRDANLHDADFHDADLRNADLRNADLRNADLRNADLRNANLSDANLLNTDQLNFYLYIVLFDVNHSGADLRNADLRNANLIGANLIGANLRNADLSDTNLSNADLGNTNLSNANLIGANLIGANLRNADLKNTSLNNASLSNVSFINASLNNANLSNANLSNADLIGANLSDANLRNADLRNADLRNTDFRNADLRDTDLRNADLLGADLRNADLRNASLIDVNLRNADLRNTDLSNADLLSADLLSSNLLSANLLGADLSNANLRNANLRDADFTRTDLENVKNLTAHQCKKAWRLWDCKNLNTTLYKQLETEKHCLFEARGCKEKEPWWMK